MATMLLGATRVDDQNVNPTWKAHVNTNSGIKVAYVKIVEPRKIFVESVCALLGRKLGLPIPKPMIVQISHAALKDEVKAGSSILAFGSEDASHPSFRRKMNQNNQEAMELIRKYSKILEISIFDEWIANTDRNIGNILFDGKNNFHFIDHELALPSGFHCDFRANRNQLLETCFAQKSEFEKHKASKEVSSEIVPAFSALNLKTALDKSLSSIYYNESEAKDILDIVSERLSYVARHSDIRMNIKQQGLAI